MKVEFDDLDDFVAELKAERSDDLEYSHYVRVTCETQSPNDGVTLVFFKAGFLANGGLCELRTFCGEDWVGSKQEGTEAFRAMLHRLDAVCQELKVLIRGGAYCG